jgi:hypothetical protein
MTEAYYSQSLEGICITALFKYIPVKNSKPRFVNSKLEILLIKQELRFEKLDTL